ncbi:hypothetical protein T484DRAFT_1879268 [Baffinella frigidus]|nr:hypothetical protein T484DRAFT_1879268 [Cryptophyta sp. CCMP2293]
MGNCHSAKNAIVPIDEKGIGGSGESFGNPHADSRRGSALKDAGDGEVVEVQDALKRMEGKTEPWTALRMMHLHGANADVQGTGCRVLSSILSSNQQAHAVVVTNVETVIRAMRAHRGSGVQENACRVLMKLAAQNNWQELVVAEKGGVEAVVSAMRSHASHAGIQWRGSGALMNLALHKKNKAKVVEAGGVEQVVEAGGVQQVAAAMAAHPTNTQVQEFGLGVFLNVAWHRRELQACVMEVMDHLGA